MTAASPAPPDPHNANEPKQGGNLAPALDTIGVETTMDMASSITIEPPSASMNAAAGEASPFRIAAMRYYAATEHFNKLPADLETVDPGAHAREQELYIATVDDVDRAPCATWEEFGEAFEIATVGGASLPNDDLVMKLLEDVRRLRGVAHA